MEPYTLIKFVHIVFAIIAFGYNASYGLWLGRAAREPKETQLFTLRTIRFMDDSFRVTSDALWFSMPGARRPRSAGCSARRHG